jgi:hypothetical protein
MSGPLVTRLAELAVALTVAKDRLRSAVAEEIGRAAGSALRDALAAGAGRPVVSRPSYAPRDPWDDDRRWDERDPWEDDRTAYRDRHDCDEPDDEPTDARPAGIPPAVAVGLGLWRWWLGRRGSWRIAVALGLAAGVTTVLGGPALRAALATLAAAAELLSPTALALDTRLGWR